MSARRTSQPKPPGVSFILPEKQTQPIKQGTTRGPYQTRSAKKLQKNYGLLPTIKKRKIPDIESFLYEIPEHPPLSSRRKKQVTGTITSIEEVEPEQQQQQQEEQEPSLVFGSTPTPIEIQGKPYTELLLTKPTVLSPAELLPFTKPSSSILPPDFKRPPSPELPPFEEEDEEEETEPQSPEEEREIKPSSIPFKNFPSYQDEELMQASFPKTQLVQEEQEQQPPPQVEFEDLPDAQSQSSQSLSIIPLSTNTYSSSSLSSGTPSSELSYQFPGSPTDTGEGNGNSSFPMMGLGIGLGGFVLFLFFLLLFFLLIPPTTTTTTTITTITKITRLHPQISREGENLPKKSTSFYEKLFGWIKSPTTKHVQWFWGLPKQSSSDEKSY